jgi:serine/threonine-protein kinase
LREIGSGGTGTVYEAENLSVGKRVAVKLMNPAAFEGQDGKLRFLTEARAAARIAHANVVDVHDLGPTKDGGAFIVMELLRGETLQEVIETRGPLAPAYACELLLQVLAGLSAAHAQGIVHADLKPANVLVTHPRPDRPLLKVLDFGLARATRAAASGDGVPSKPVYQAPEQVSGGPVDYRTDVFHASAMLFALLAGTEPFDGASASEVRKNVAAGRSKDLRALVPELPAGLLNVVRDGMALRPQDRIASAEELAERLRPFCAADVSLAPRRGRGLGDDAVRPLIVAPTPDMSKASTLPLAQSSVIPVDMPRVARVAHSLLVSPRIPRPPSAPRLRLGQDFMPLPGDPEYKSLLELRRSPTSVPERRSSFRGNVVPALTAIGVGFGVGIVLAWSAGLL